MSKVFRPFFFAVAVAFAAAPAMLPAAEQGSVGGGAIAVSDTISAKVTVVGIKKKTRELTVRDEGGSEAVIVVPKEARNFPQIKKGDIIEITYHVAAVTALKKVGDTNVAGEVTTAERAPAGGKPGMMATHTKSIVATVIEIDAGKRLLTLEGPKGGVVTLKVPADMTAFDSLKKGDKISAVYSEAVAVTVKTPPKKKK